MKRLTFLACLVALSLAACGRPTATPEIEPTSGAETALPAPTKILSADTLVMPGDHLIADWKVSVPEQSYGADNLFSLVDGQADSFLAYNFEKVTTERYENNDGVLLTVEVWQVAAPADAYGLFTLNRAGSPVKMGTEGDGDPGRRVAFWQDRFYVVVNANGPVPDVQVMAFAYFVSISLPSGGQTPALVKNLPAQGLTERGFIFFHQAISVQDQVALGSDNILGLSPQTNGVAARYTLDGTPARLMLIQYPDPSQASTGLQALRKASDLDLIVADVKGPILGAVFGKASQTAATGLLQAALAGAQP
jgi:hypothetical protein